MTILKDVAAELLGMFLADARLTIATLVVVSAVAGLILGLRIEPVLGGALLLVGCVLVLVEAVVREARRRRAS